MTEKVCIIGGGAAGVGLMWTLAKADVDVDITLIDFREHLGGHALTVTVEHNGCQIPVDTGVQFYIPLLYPNISALTKLDGIKNSVPTEAYDDLRVACAFPRKNGEPRNWGNFADYQRGPDFAMYTAAMKDDAERFQDFIDFSLIEGWAGKTLAEYLANPPLPYEDQAEFVNFFLYPYLSIINGYGAALSGEVKFEDLFPLFAHVPGIWPGLGSFTSPGSGYQRFVDGASSLIEALNANAQSIRPSRILLNTTVSSVVAADTLPGPVTVTYSQDCEAPVSETFDKAVITTDMDATRKMLDVPQNAELWAELYSKYLSASDWPLLPGACYIHTDEELLSPDLRQQCETLQFTAYYAPASSAPGYDLFKTYTTYLQKNLHDNVDASGLYLTMYGYVPDASQGDKVPDPKKVLFQETWTHGMWLPTFMMDAKKALHHAQPPGASLSYPGQLETGIYFAGNNTTADSLEHAFLSGAIIGNYGWDAPYPLDSLLGFGMYELFYKEFMFPAASASEKLARRAEGHPMGQNG